VGGCDLVRSEFGCQDCGADVFQQASLRDDVANVRDVVKRDCFGRQQGRCHARQRRVFGAADRDPAVKRPAAGNTKFVHDAGKSK